MPRLMVPRSTRTTYGTVRPAVVVVVGHIGVWVSTEGARTHLRGGRGGEEVYGVFERCEGARTHLRVVGEVFDEPARALVPAEPD